VVALDSLGVKVFDAKQFARGDGGVVHLGNAIRERLFPLRG
jgi:hypothetical protein